MTDPDRDPTQASPLCLWQWMFLLGALVLGTIFGSLIFGIR